MEAVAAKDAAALAACFAPDAALRALVPPGLRERSGAGDAAALITGWFEDTTELDLLESSVDTVEDRLHVSYRIACVEEGRAYLVEQQLYCAVEGGKIRWANLLCSGLRPRDGR